MASFQKLRNGGVDDVVGELVCWKFINDGHHIVRNKVSMIMEIRGK
jgi:hypothetical protein